MTHWRALSANRQKTNIYNNVRTNFTDMTNWQAQMRVSGRDLSAGPKTEWELCDNRVIREKTSS